MKCVRKSTPLFGIPTLLSSIFFFSIGDTASTASYTLSLHDALPIFGGLKGCRRDFSFHPRQRHEGAAGLHDVVLDRSEEHTSELQSQSNLVCRLLLEKKNYDHLLSRDYSLMLPPQQLLVGGLAGVIF